MTIIVVDKDTLYVDTLVSAGTSSFEIKSKVVRIDEVALVVAAGDYLTPLVIEQVFEGHMDTLVKPTLKKVGRLARQMRDVFDDCGYRDTQVVVVTAEYAFTMTSTKGIPIKLERRDRIEPGVWAHGSGANAFRRNLNAFHDVETALVESVQLGQGCGGRIQSICLNYLRKG